MHVGALLLMLRPIVVIVPYHEKNTDKHSISNECECIHNSTYSENLNHILEKWLAVRVHVGFFSVGFYNGIVCEIDKNKLYIAQDGRKVFGIRRAYCSPLSLWFCRWVSECMYSIPIVCHFLYSVDALSIND